MIMKKKRDKNFSERNKTRVPMAEIQSDGREIVIDQILHIHSPSQVLHKKLFKFFCKNHKKTSVLESLFNEVLNLRPTTVLKKRF